MTDRDDSTKRDDLLRKIENADSQDAEIEEKARQLLQDSRHQRDLNKAFTDPCSYARRRQ